MDGLHHIHERKDLYRHLAPYPHPETSPLRRWFDHFIIVIGIISPLLALPQIIQIWVNRDAGGVSFITWGGLTITSIFWIIYGCLHKETPIIVAYVLSAIVNAAVALGVLLYR